MFKQKQWTLLAVAALAFVVACGGSSDTAPADTPASSPKPSEAKPEPVEPSTQGETGTASISGTVSFEGAVPRLRPLQMSADPGCAKKHSEDVMPEFLVLGENNTMANVLVYVKGGVSGGYPVPAEPVVLDQQGCRYAPHVVSAQTGQLFKILNSDGLLHNVHGLPEKNQPFNKAMPAAVTESEYTFDKEEIFKIKCDVHTWMGAWVGVFAHPFHAVTGTDGAFSLEGLPAGSYEIEAHHERLGTLTAQVTVGDGEAGSSDFKFVKN